jgi:hypothetical protein
MARVAVCEQIFTEVLASNVEELRGWRRVSLKLRVSPIFGSLDPHQGQNLISMTDDAGTLCHVQPAERTSCQSN